MTNCSEQIYKELEEIDSRIYFIQDVYKTIIQQVYQINPDLLNLSENTILLSSFIKNFHHQSIPYCEQLQNDLKLLMSIIGRINETKCLFNANEMNSSMDTRNFLAESLNSPNQTIRSILIDHTQTTFPTANVWTKENSVNFTLTTDLNGIKELTKNKNNDENLIDFSSDSVEKSCPNFESKIISKIKKNISYSSLSVSQSADKSSKLSERSKFKKLKYYLLDSSNKFECFVSHVLNFLGEKININFSLFYENPLNNQNTKVEIFDDSLIYAGRYSEDKKWYRVKIISINEIDKTVEVLYIDYGNSEILSFEELRYLDDIFLKESVFALPVSLAMGMPIDSASNWSEEATSEFSNLALYRWSRIETFMVKKWPIYFCHIEIKLDHEKQDALEYLEARNLATIENNLIIAEKYQEKIKELTNYYGLSIFLSANCEPSSIKDSEKNCLSRKNTTCGSENGDSRKKGTFNFKYGEKYRFVVDDFPPKIIPLDSDQTFLFKICEIYSTNEFYVNLLDENFDEYNLFEKHMNEFYEKNQSYLARFALKKKYDFVFLNSMCVAFSPRDKLWYRAKITNLDKSLIRLIYIDYGICDYLKPSNLYPLLKQFIEVPPITIVSKLNKDLSEKWTESDLNSFISSVANYEFFRAKVNFAGCQLSYQFKKTLEVNFLSAYDKNENEICYNLKDLNNNGIKAIETDIEHFESASCFGCLQNKSLVQPLKIDLPNEDANFKHERIKMYIDDCTSYVTGNECGGADRVPNQTNETKLIDQGEKPRQELLLKESKITVDDLLFKNWDPRAEEYHSAKNFYGFNEQNGESHAFGYETLYEKNICEQFNKYGHCSKKKCHLYHKKSKETLVSSKSIKIYHECFETHNNLVKNFVFLSNVRYIGKEMFEATIIGGVDKNNNELNCTNLAKLNSSINDYYGGKKFLPEKSTIFQIGQIVIARSNLCGLWLRAKIIKAYNIDKLELATYEVEFLDFKGREVLCLKYLYLIREEYLNYVPSFCIFKLSGISIRTSHSKIQETLSKAKLKFKMFWAKIQSLDNENIFHIQLFCCSDSTCIDLNNFFVNKKFAIN